MSSPAPVGLAVGVPLELAGRVYRVIRLDSGEDSSGVRTIGVEAWALWYDLAKMPALPPQEWQWDTAIEILTGLLAGSGWAVGTASALGQRNFTWAGGCNRLAALRELEKVFHAEITWDTVARTVSLAPGGGVDTGLFFLRGKNLRGIEVETSIADTVYRLYPRGANGLTIAAANNGIPYLEIPSPLDPPPSAELVAEEFTDAQSLKEYAEAVFAAMHTPRVSYTCAVLDISALPGEDAPPLRVGDIVTAYDEAADISVKTRVVRMRYRVEEPWNSEVELSTARLDLADALLPYPTGAAEFDAVKPDDLAELMVFNHLLNSRADDGFAYLVNDGWEVDNTRGFSGLASFRAVGVLGVAKTLTQSVWPAHRENYVISLRARLENVQLGAQGRVGVEVVVHYADGTSETHFVSLV